MTNLAQLTVIGDLGPLGLSAPDQENSEGDEVPMPKQKPNPKQKPRPRQMIPSATIIPHLTMVHLCLMRKAQFALSPDRES